ncbi:sulfite exporter TauE/SafE family protein [Thalassotalea sp. HSM 43]|uniref:sulfite exporter TauE/SafE family protein n=1 Tax=Thalassotalea sp. HSM 43 TaxID=2552945 RepID=UPI00108049CD|nr:sulfite exporter TauE/SafE family protein [Thalassotalea sp. HSM 43]QBY05904.1 sulfite exporter TauE/SafE family protein [Thalassotalea sp. HSM 43]
MALEYILAFLLLGGFVGVMAGLLGIGGGALMVPMLTSIFAVMGFANEVIVHLALGTSMACIIVTSMSSLTAHHKRGGVIWPIVKSMVPGILIGTFAATFVAAKTEPLYLALFFALFMSYVSLQMFINKQPKPEKSIGGQGELIAAGSGIGAISALVSIGGGTLTVPYLLWRNINITKAIGTSAACGLPIALAGTLGYILNGYNEAINLEYTFGFVYWPAVVLISLTSYFTAPIGVRLAHTLPVAMLKKVFAVFVVIISIKMVMTVLA